MGDATTDKLSRSGLGESFPAGEEAAERGGERAAEKDRICGLKYGVTMG